MPTKPPTATQVCVDPSLASGEGCAEARRTVHATLPAPQAPAKADWWGDAWTLWNRHPQGDPQAGDALADNLGLNTH